MVRGVVITIIGTAITNRDNRRTYLYLLSRHSRHSLPLLPLHLPHCNSRLVHRVNRRVFMALVGSKWREGLQASLPYAPLRVFLGVRSSSTSGIRHQASGKKKEESREA